MGRIVILLGPSGSGKSRSTKNLDPKETIVVNVLKKDLPFKGSRILYNSENKNIVTIDLWDKLIEFIKWVDSNESIKNLVIDDMRFVMEKELFRRSKESGYGKFTDIAYHFQQIIEACENTRESLNVAMILHDEDVFNDKILISKKAKTVGKMVDDHYNPLEVVTVCLYCEPEFDKTGKPVYQFFTQSTIVNNIKIPAKSPEGMFDNLTIPNDLAEVFKKMDEFYN